MHVLLKYTYIGKIPKCDKMFFLAIFRDIFQKKTQRYWYSTSIDSDNPTLGHKIFAIKSMGVFEVFWVILVKFWFDPLYQSMSLYSYHVQSQDCNITTGIKYRYLNCIPKMETKF